MKFHFQFYSWLNLSRSFWILQWLCYNYQNDKKWVQLTQLFVSESISQSLLTLQIWRHHLLYCQSICKYSLLTLHELASFYSKLQYVVCALHFTYTYSVLCVSWWHFRISRAWIIARGHGIFRTSIQIITYLKLI